MALRSWKRIQGSFPEATASTARVDAALKEAGFLGGTVGAGMGIDGSAMSMEITVRKYDCKSDTMKKALTCDVDYSVKADINMNFNQEQPNDGGDVNFGGFFNF